MSTTTAKLASAKLNDANGIPDDTAEKMYHALGSKHMAIVELEVFERTEGLSENANHTVRLRPIHLELATGDHATFLRDLSHSLYTDRQPRGLDQIDEDDADEIIRRGRSVLLTCQTCLHPTADDRISHYQGDNPNDENAWCTWNDDGTQVYTDDAADQHGPPATTEADGQDQAAADLTGAIPVGADA